MDKAAGDGGELVAVALHLGAGDVPCESVLVASAAADKRVSLWRLTPGDGSAPAALKRCYRASLPKKCSALCFVAGPSGGDGEGGWLLAADKWGDVFGVPLADVPLSRSECVDIAEGAEASEHPLRPMLVFGHCCSIVAAMDAARSDTHTCAIASGDRDGRVRLTCWPSALTRERCGGAGGASEVLAFCLGHEGFVTVVRFVGGGGAAQSLLATGSGDGTVRLWDWRTGEELSCWRHGERQESAGGSEGTTQAAVIDLVELDAGHLAVAIEGVGGVTVLSIGDNGRVLCDDIERTAGLRLSLGALAAPPSALAPLGDGQLAVACRKVRTTRGGEAEATSALAVTDALRAAAGALIASIHQPSTAAAGDADDELPFLAVQLPADMRKVDWTEKQKAEGAERHEAKKAAKRHRKQEQREAKERKQREQGLL